MKTFDRALWVMGILFAVQIAFVAGRAIGQFIMMFLGT